MRGDLQSYNDNGAKHGYWEAYYENGIQVGFGNSILFV